jgi:TonB family protein
VPLREVAPAFPFELRSLSLKPTVVAVRVTIDKTGKVQKVEPLPQGNIHRLFIMEAVHAAQLWKFQPARRGDEPVPSESVLRFTFNQ